MRDTIDMAREIAAEYMKAERFQTWTHDYMMERLMELVTASAESERDEILRMSGNQWFKSQARYDEAIRARGNT